MQPSPFNQTGAAAVVRVLQIAKELREHPVFGYAMAFVTVGAATFLQWLLQSQYAGAPFLTIYPAVILSALVGGRGPGFLAAVLAGGSQWALFIPTLHWSAVASYAVDASVCVMLIDYINRTLDLLRAHIDREKQAKHHQYLLAKELHHRIQNLFTVMQGVIRFSLPGEEPVKESAIRQRLVDRLQSMSEANRAITESMGSGVRLLDLINGEIRGFETQFDIGGAANVTLGAQLTQDFSLILHELVTNALKYGALSGPQGRVRVRLDWKPPVLSFVWQECDGPTVIEPGSSGFGSRILGAFARSFCQNVETRYEASGLRYALQIESSQIGTAEPATAAPPAWQDPASVPTKAAEPRRRRSTIEREIEEAELKG